MTIRAKDFKIIQIIVCTISIFMVYTKNRNMLGISTPFTGRKFPAYLQILSNSNESCLPNAMIRFIYASTATIFPLSRWRCTKFFCAMSALIDNRTFEMHRLVVAFRRTIFSCILPYRYNTEFFGTNFTRFMNTLMDIFPCPATASGAEFKCLPTIAWHPYLCRTIGTTHQFVGDSYAP